MRDVRQGRGGDRQARQAHLRLRGVLHHRRGAQARRQAEALPPAASGQDERGLPQPGEIGQRIARRQLLLQAPHHVLHAAEVRQGHHRLVGLHCRHHPEAARQPPVRRRRGVGQQVRQLLRARRLLHRAAEPGHPHRRRLHADRAQPHAHRRGQGRRPEDHRHERLPLPHEGRREGPGLHAVRGPGRRRERREAHALRERRVLHEDRGGDAHRAEGLPRGLRHHRGGGREGGRGAGARFHPSEVPLARGRDGGELLPSPRAGGPGQALWQPGAAGGAGARRLRDGHHHPAGLPGVLPHRAGVHRVGAQPGHRRGPGPRLGRRRHRGVRHGHHRARPAVQRPAVRAIPVARARGDARYRRRLRAGTPRRGHQPHQGRVRRGPRVPGHHVRHAAGEERRARRRARAGLPVQHRRPHLQADRRRAGHHHRQGACHEPRPQEGVRDRGGREGRHRRREVHRGARARRGRARLRHHHLPRPHGRPRAHEARHQGRRHHHPVRRTLHAGARPAEDGLPGPAHARRAHHRVPQHRAALRHEGRARGDSRRRRGRLQAHAVRQHGRPVPG